MSDQNKSILLKLLFLIIIVTPILAIPSLIISKNQTIVNAQPKDPGKKAEAEKLLQEGKTLINQPGEYLAGLNKYLEALIIYQQIGDQAGEKSTRQVWEKLLRENLGDARQKSNALNQAGAKLINTLKIIPADNAKAIALNQLTADGLGFLVRADQLNKNQPTINQARATEWQVIAEDFAYLDQQITDPRGELAPLPENWQNYLDKHATNLTAIRKIILNGEPIEWKFILDFFQVETPLPNLRGFVDLNKILLLDAIAQYQKGNQQAMLDNLQASWILNQSLQQSPLLIEQLVSVIVAKYQAGILRKLGNLPTSWQEKLLSHDYRPSVLKSMEVEAYKIFEFSSTNPDIQTITPLWQAIATQAYMLEIYRQLASQNICTFQESSLLTSEKMTELETNVYSFVRQWQKAGQVMVDLELTKNILQLRQLHSAGQEIPNNPIKSNICQGTNWLSAVKPTEFSIKINPDPLEWPGEKLLPLSFTGQLK